MNAIAAFAYANARASFFSRFRVSSDDHVAATLSDRSFAAEKSLALLHAYIKQIPDPPIPRRGASGFSRSAIARVRGRRKKRRRSLAARKNGRSGPAESLMRPTKRVARLRATNNSCLYPFLPLSSFLLILSPRILVSPRHPRCPSSLSLFSPFRSHFASLVRRSNSNSCRKNPPRPNALTSERSSWFRSQIRWSPTADNKRSPCPFVPAQFAPIISETDILHNYRLYFSIFGNRSCRRPRKV